MPHSTEQATSPTGGATCRRPQRISTSSLQQPKLLSPTALYPSGGGPKFPRIDECAHFHYDTVDCGKVELQLLDEAPDGTRWNSTFDFEKSEQIYWITVKCKGKSWVIRRIPAQFKALDELLHECVYDRKFTLLQPLNDITNCDNEQIQRNVLKKYISRLSELPEDQMSCAPVLHWFDMDNKGTKLVAALRETADINIPAVAAAHTVRRYTAQSSDELSLEVGDMVSIIDMSDPNWWRGKCKLQVGSFPSQCVKRISDAKHADEVHAVVNLPSSPTSSSPPNLNTSKTKPIVKKHGKIMDFLRSFLVTRPTKSRLKQTGILKERVFGCDLGEYLHNCGDDIPVVVMDCTDFVEKYGIVDGIYRISGVSSHVQNLRHEYDCERRPNLNRDPSGRGEQSLCDPHSVAGLCKLYFRELPNPLLTYQLYNRFATAINASEDERLLKIHDVIQQLPPPHYRTLKHLVMHLQRMSRHDEKTSMHCRNLAIVWAPNLLRSRDLEAGLAAFTEARVQSVVTEFLIANADILFSDQLQNMQLSRGQKPPRPKSLMVLSGPKLISLEEAQARSRAGDGFSKPSSENFASIVAREEESLPIRRSRKLSSPPGFPSGEARSSPSKPIAIIPLTGGQSASMKRRQSMDPKFGGSRQQHNNFPNNPRHYSSQHSTGSTGWRSKLGSFLKKGNTTTEYQVAKQNDKRALRRSQSDDSLLSSHSTRQDDDDNDDDQSDAKSSDAVLATEPPTLRQSNSPRSPRPKGNIFLSDDTFEPKDAVAILSGRNDAKYSTPNTPPTPSAETNPSSHNPFSGLDSDFPGIMGESGLGFNPLQYSPTFSSDSGIPDLPHCPDNQNIEQDHNGPTSNIPVSSLNGKNPHKDDECPQKLIGSLEEIKIVNYSQADTSTSKKQANRNNETHSSEIETPYVNHKIQDLLNANVRMREASANTERSDSSSTNTMGLEPDVAKIVRKDRLQTVADAIESSYSKTRTDTADSNYLSKGVNDKDENSEDTTAKSRRSYYWKTEEIDSLTEIDKLCADQKDAEKAEQTSTPPRQHEKLSQKDSRPVDLPEAGSYSVQYACNRENVNGRTHQSIIATFVQDRPLDSKLRRPHSIRRSMDVPPTDIQQSSTEKSRVNNSRQQRSIYDITRRNRAYTAWVSQHQKDLTANQTNRTRYRSLSAGDKLNLENQPVAVPRANPAKPVPLPRHVYGQTYAEGGNDAVFVIESNTTSAPTTPMNYDFSQSAYSHEARLDNEQRPLQYTSPFQIKTLTQEPTVVPQIEQNQARYNDYNSSVSTTSNPLMMPKPAPPGIVSPSDNVCASTVLSWV